MTGQPLGPAHLRYLQRAAGNRALQRLVRPAEAPAVAPAATGRRQPFPLAVQKSPAASPKGPPVSAAGLRGLDSGARASSFGKIRSLLAEAEKAKGAAKLKALQKVNGLAIKWLNDHRASTDPLDQRRRPEVDRLVEQVAGEMSALTRGQAQEIYAANLKGEAHPLQQAGKKGGVDPRMRALMPGSNGRPGEKGQALAEQRGLSEAEAAGIRIFTGNDYLYINPATANNEERFSLEERVDDPQNAPHFDAVMETIPLSAEQQRQLAGLSGVERSKKIRELKKPELLRILREEGSLHSAMAMAGMKKLEKHRGKEKGKGSTVYRGMAYSSDDFKTDFQEGKTFSFNAFASSSKSKSEAQKFALQSAKGNVDKEAKKQAGKKKPGKVQDIAVVLIIDHPEGRDVSTLSNFEKEQEVTLMPAFAYTVGKPRKMTPPKTSDDGGSAPAVWYEIRLHQHRATPQKGTPAPRGGK